MARARDIIDDALATAMNVMCASVVTTLCCVIGSLAFAEICS